MNVRDPRLFLLVLVYLLAGVVVGAPRVQRWLSKLLTGHPELLANARPAEYYRSREFRKWLIGVAIFWWLCGILALVLIFV